NESIFDNQNTADSIKNYHPDAEKNKRFIPYQFNQCHQRVIFLIKRYVHTVAHRQYFYKGLLTPSAQGERRGEARLNGAVLVVIFQHNRASFYLEAIVVFLYVIQYRFHLFHFF